MWKSKKRNGKGRGEKSLHCMPAHKMCAAWQALDDAWLWNAADGTAFQNDGEA